MSEAEFVFEDEAKGAAAVAARDQHHEAALEALRGARGMTFVVLCQPEIGGTLTGLMAIETLDRKAVFSALLDLANRVAAGKATP